MGVGAVTIPGESACLMHIHPGHVNLCRHYSPCNHPWLQLPSAGAQRKAAELGVAFVAPDTSPRGLGVEGEADSWDFGVGAGFYVNATVRGRLSAWGAAVLLACTSVLSAVHCQHQNCKPPSWHVMPAGMMTVGI
jgi:hypothetical protein